MAVPSMRTLQACRSAAAASFDPTSISGCKLWLDASVAGDFTFSSGTVVSQWNDRSGEGNHVVQATGSMQPTRNVTVNGLSAVHFDHSDYLFDTAPNSAIGTNGLTVFVVFRKTGTAGSYDGFPACLARSGSLNWHEPFSGYNERRSYMSVADGWQVNYSTTDIRYQTNWCVLAEVGSSTALSEWKDGTLVSTASVTAGYPWDTDTQTIAIGGRGDGGIELEGDIAEVLMYDSPLSTGDRQSVEDYLSAKWGTP